MRTITTVEELDAPQSAFFSAQEGKPMTTNFTAKNGVTVNIDHDEHMIVDDRIGFSAVHMWPDLVAALREYFQHERDQELGRWRDEENPNMVVYPAPENDDKDGRAVRVIDEATGAYASLWERDVKHFERGSMYATAARYFAAHPEPKPWHDAKPGEVWALTIDGTEHPAQTIVGRIVIYPHDADPEFFIPTLIPTNTIGDIWEHTWSPTDHRITAGRRLWPEESDDE